MNHLLEKILAKPKKLAVGLMSGTSLDGMDAALVEIEGAGLSTKIRLLEFFTLNYSAALRSCLMEAVMGEKGGSRLVSGLNFLMGELAAEAALEVCRRGGISAAAIDFAGSHGQTIYHQAEAAPLAGYTLRSTLQIGEASVIAEKIGCPVVSDFRVRDMAAGGQGAPLVPYTEYLLYRKKDKPIALQNIGGIGNVTFLPAGAGPEDILAFDTGPGNMIIDTIALALTGKNRDEGGRIGASGHVNRKLLAWMFAFDSEYLERSPPKSTGRERYNTDYTAKLLEAAGNLSLEDIFATVTRYTAETIALGITKFCSAPAELYVSGGGVHNECLMTFIRELLPRCSVRTGNDLGIPADAKEAAAFAILANEALHGICNNAPAATGANHPVLMGKISF